MNNAAKQRFLITVGDKKFYYQPGKEDALYARLIPYVEKTHQQPIPSESLKAHISKTKPLFVCTACGKKIAKNTYQTVEKKVMKHMHECTGHPQMFHDTVRLAQQ